MNNSKPDYIEQFESLASDLNETAREINEIDSRFDIGYKTFLLRQAKNHGCREIEESKIDEHFFSLHYGALWRKIYGDDFRFDPFYFAKHLRSYLSEDEELRKLWSFAGLDRLPQLEKNREKIKGSISKILAHLKPKEALKIVSILDSEEKERQIDRIIGFEDEYHMERDWTKYCDYENKYKRFPGASWYGKTPYDVVDKFLKLIPLGENDVFYDLGSGYGQVVNYVASTTNIKKAIGVEIAPWRVDKSIKMQKYLGLENVEFKRDDVLKTDFSDGTVFFLFNPFSPDVMEKVGEKLSKMKGRKVVSLGATCDYFSNVPWAKKIKKDETGSDLRVYEII
jgi:hypothetical protein